jgi:uncharacterized protein YlaI
MTKKITKKRRKTIPAKDARFHALCDRCEHRVSVIERRRKDKEASGPRYECGDLEHATGGCYMYRPVSPVAVKPAEGDPRPIGGNWLLAGRVRGVDVVAVDIKQEKLEDGTYVFWPVKRKKVKEKPIAIKAISGKDFPKTEYDDEEDGVPEWES